MIWKIAWRNVWRNKVRSTVVIIAIAVGLWAGVFASGFVSGLMEQKIDSVIRLEMSHFQVHHPEFRDEFLPEFTIPAGKEKMARIQSSDSVRSVSGRVISSVMIGSSKQSGGIKVTGIIPEEEKAVTDLHEHVEEGKYLEGIKRNPILISRKTAEKYKVELRSKVVLTLHDVHDEITAGAFRVAGIYDSKNPMYDEMNAFVRKADLQKLLGVGEEIHEIAVLLKEHDLADTMAASYQAQWPELEVLSWKDLATGMRFMVEVKDTYTFFIVGIILIALLFSIINTMLMAVLERVHEIGMLKALGMNKPRIFAMILLETIYLALIGGPLGLLLSWTSISYFGVHGIDLGDAAYGEMGYSNLVYPQLEMTVYAQVTVMVLIMALLAAIYPARKALKLNPVEAIRKI